MLATPQAFVRDPRYVAAHRLCRGVGLSDLQ